MFVIFKSFAGCDYKIYNHEGKVEKVISFKGGCYANNIEKADFDILCRAYPSFKKAVDEGFIVANEGDKQKAISKAVDETLQSDLDKQEATQKANARRTKAEVKKA